MKRPKTLDALLSMRMTEELTGDLVLDTALACAAQDMEWELDVWEQANSPDANPGCTLEECGSSTSRTSPTWPESPRRPSVPIVPGLRDDSPNPTVRT